MHLTIAVAILNPHLLFLLLGHPPFLAPFICFAGAVKMFDCIRFLMERGVVGLSAPKMSLEPPPGGFRTLKEKKIEAINNMSS